MTLRAGQGMSAYFTSMVQRVFRATLPRCSAPHVTLHKLPAAAGTEQVYTVHPVQLHSPMRVG